ncbi:MAG TPA: UvrB/UvrC motif-containing protein, partial [Armatimonadota bacterium]|nr:UvrB/UvrC motif-containing protein [Armatimonadota bacterium]
EGREESVLQLLLKRMERAAERLQFELAARLRDAVRHIQAVGGRQHALLSAVQDLSLVAACPSRGAGRLCLFVFRSGRLVFQEEAPLEELRETRARRAWARRLAAADLPTGAATSATIDSALLDEIQIVTAWMKQKTRQGAYWQLPPDAAPAEVAQSLDLWLAEQADPGAERLAA